VVRVNNIWANISDQGSAGLQYRRNLPWAFRGDVQIYEDYGGPKFTVFGCRAVSGGRGQSDYYFKAQGSQNADLVVDPGGSGGGFDDVQDLHEQRVVIVRLLMNALETIPQKGCFAQRAKMRSSLAEYAGLRLTMQTGLPTLAGLLNRQAYPGRQAAEWIGWAGKLIDNWRLWCYI
jgi:hypothetical protein